MTAPKNKKLLTAVNPIVLGQVETEARAIVVPHLEYKPAPKPVIG